MLLGRRRGYPWPSQILTEASTGSAGIQCTCSTRSSFSCAQKRNDSDQRWQENVNKTSRTRLRLVFKVLVHRQHVPNAMMPACGGMASSG